MSKVICDKALRCPIEGCGGKNPHWLDTNECGKCPKDKLARCVPLEDFDYVSVKR